MNAPGVSFKKYHRRIGIWDAMCDCGKETQIQTRQIGKDKLSCGCLVGQHNKKKKYREMVRKANTKHGLSGSRTYYSWLAMKARCYFKSHKSYVVYGGAGITVCVRWLESFENFLKDMGERPPNTTLDRYPYYKKQYNKKNCRWATPKEQAANRKVREPGSWPKGRKKPKGP